tara:strand:+ start:5389 stop:6012 length:624 start_codon:yes stop_codon:yes gene_type:complete
MSSQHKNFKSYSKQLFDAISNINENSLIKVKDEILKRIDGNGDIYIVGNGGSAANAHHIVGDYSKTFAMLGKSIKINCLSDNACYITAAANDLDYSEVFELLINTRVKKGDFLFFLSGSGNSLNLIKAARIAKISKIKTGAITGFSGGALKDLVDIHIHVNIHDMEIAEDAQIAIFHYIKQKLYSESILDEDQMPKYNKRIREDLIA